MWIDRVAPSFFNLQQAGSTVSLHAVCSTSTYVVAGPEINDVNNGKNSPIECKYMIDAAAGHWCLAISRGLPFICLYVSLVHCTLDPSICIYAYSYEWVIRSPCVQAGTVIQWVCVLLHQSLNYTILCSSTIHPSQLYNNYIYGKF
jgi:hypothetical protein